MEINKANMEGGLKMKTYKFGKPFSVVHPHEPTHQELFNKHLDALTSYEQRVKFSEADDVKPQHR